MGIVDIGAADAVGCGPTGLLEASAKLLFAASTRHKANALATSFKVWIDATDGVGV